MCCSELVCSIAAIVVRLVLLVLSVGGWIASVVGLSHVYSQLAKQDQIYSYLTIPLWMFVISAVLLYLFLVIHTFMSQCFISRWRNNAGNSALVIVNVFRVFYLLGAGGTLILGALLIALSIVSAESVHIVLAGCGSSVLFYWISEILWPLFQLRCSQENIQENAENIESYRSEELREPFIAPHALDIYMH